VHGYCGEGVDGCLVLDAVGLVALVLAVHASGLRRVVASWVAMRIERPIVKLFPEEQQALDLSCLVIRQGHCRQNTPFLFTTRQCLGLV
jgi:hypothetical protein